MMGIQVWSQGKHFTYLTTEGGFRYTYYLSSSDRCLTILQDGAVHAIFSGNWAMKVVS